MPIFIRYLHRSLVAQYDAFSKIDGGGSGRGGDDRKIDLSEWLAGYRGVADHGFVALQGLNGDAAAELLFMKMDGNGGGVVRLCYFISFVGWSVGLFELTRRFLSSFKLFHSPLEVTPTTARAY
jgi:hypothetical protein